MNKSSLLEHIRTLQREIDGLMDIVIAMEDTEFQSTHFQQENSDGWLDVRQVCKYLNISRTTFYEGIRKGVLPEGFAFGPKTIRWRISDIEAWQASKQNCREATQQVMRRGRTSRVRNISEFR